MNALLLGRFHAVTTGLAQWLHSLRSAPVDRLICVLTSADHQRTRRNPLDIATRESLVRPALERSGKPFELVRVEDVPESERWVEHVVARVEEATGQPITPLTTQVYSANRDVDELFRARGYTVVSPEVQGLTPHELVQRIADGRPWQEEASPETQAVYSRPEVRETLRQLFSQRLINDDGELGHRRDFGSYGAQMDASLQQKLDDLVKWVRPGCIVDKGCGTGKLLVELSRRFPESRLVGVDLSREFLRLCDENTYATDDVTLVFGDVAAPTVPAGTASCIIYSSVMHEVHSYNGYRREEIGRALRNAFVELGPSGHVLIRDGVSPPPASWRMRFLTPQAREVFERFAREFKHGEGIDFEQVKDAEVRLSSHDANEFLCKKDYLKNWHIEVNEEFGVHTLDEWRQVIIGAGFEPLHLSESVNPWIAQNRYEGSVALMDNGGAAIGWPATNCVVVGRKP